MAGRHDRAADLSAPGLLATGPVVIRGVTRSVRDALRPGQDSRHRASSEEVGSANADEPARAGHWVDEDAAPANVPLESAIEVAEVKGDDVAEKRRPTDGRDENPSSEPAAGDVADADLDPAVATPPLEGDPHDPVDVLEIPIDDGRGPADDRMGGDVPEDPVDGDGHGPDRSDPDESGASPAGGDDLAHLGGAAAQKEPTGADALGSTAGDQRSIPLPAAVAASAPPAVLGGAERAATAPRPGDRRRRRPRAARPGAPGSSPRSW